VDVNATVEFAAAGNYEVEIECTADSTTEVAGVDTFEAGESWVGATWDVSGSFDIPSGATELSVTVRGYAL
jgi:hypothetical protein